VCFVKRLLTIFAFAGGLLGLGNYVTEGWTMLSGGRDFTTVSNVASVVLLAVASRHLPDQCLSAVSQETEDEKIR
jgi:hypothetical protein